MAIIMKTSPAEYLNALGMSADYMEQVFGKHDLTLTAAGVKVSKDGEVKATLPLKISDMVNPCTSIEEKKKKYNEVLEAIADYEAGLVCPVQKPEEWSPSKIYEASLPTIPEALSDEKKSKKPLEAVEDVKGTVEKMLQASKVPLKKADTLYQPVFGTDTSSCYFVVALSERMNVAARWIGKKLSVRVEGVLAESDKNTLIGLNMNMSGSSHASAHFTDISAIMVHKVVGSVILGMAGMGNSIKTPMPDMNLLRDKGS